MRLLSVLCLSLLLVMPDAKFEAYPGADASAPWFQKYAAEAKAEIRKINRRAELQVWMSTDSFDKVLAFYSRLGKVHRQFGQAIAGNLREKSGRDVQMVHVLFDGAAGPVSSLDYVSIQRPIVVSFEPLVVHDVTLIAWYRTKP